MQFKVDPHHCAWSVTEFSCWHHQVTELTQCFSEDSACLKWNRNKEEGGKEGRSTCSLGSFLEREARFGVKTGTFLYHRHHHLGSNKCLHWSSPPSPFFPGSKSALPCFSNVCFLFDCYQWSGIFRLPPIWGIQPRLSILFPSFSFRQTFSFVSV